MYENLENLKLKSRDQNYHQWQSSILITCLRLYHVSTLLYCMKSIKNRNNKYKSKPNLQLAFSGISSFSDWLLIC